MSTTRNTPISSRWKDGVHGRPRCFPKVSGNVFRFHTQFISLSINSSNRFLLNESNNFQSPRPDVHLVFSVTSFSTLVLSVYYGGTGEKKGKVYVVSPRPLPLFCRLIPRRHSLLPPTHPRDPLGRHTGNWIPFSQRLRDPSPSVGPS